jgi:hypothetical protein
MSSEPPIIPEPLVRDDRVGLDGETTWDFMARSTWIRAAETRAFYNASLTALPEASRGPLTNALRAGLSESPLLEMLTGRLLQLLGATQLEYEPPVGTRHVDWRATFPDGTLHVEAFAPVYNAESGEVAKRQLRLVDELRKRIPPGWWIMPFRLPPLAGHASLGDFRRVADELVEQIPPADQTSRLTKVELVGALPQGRVHITAFRDDPGGLASYPMISHVDNSEQVLRASWMDRRKRSQGRAAPAPALLAIPGSFLGADLDDFEMALYGRDVRLGREPDGAMVEDDPPWAGVLAIPTMSPASAEQPVILMAPRYLGPPLPAAMTQLEVRRLVPGGIETAPATVPDAWAGIRWASMAR